MRAAGAVTAAVLAVALLGGCGSGGPSEASGPAGSSGAPATSPPAPTTPATTTPSASAPGSPSASAPGGSPGPTGSPAPTASPDPRAEHLVTVIRSGGFAGRSTGLLVRGDGSWSLVDDKAAVLRTGRLAPAALEELRRALGAADFARLPREAKADPPIHDGFRYAFTYGGHTVSGDEEALAPALGEVLEHLPSFSATP
ncbi:hypothetical protein [Streptomyces sp. NPDC048606]|uniref:hypothetical protein n=1 Tax=Streptomyces sp. NPDC048606 TaxID=3154726 RepID=UPI0034273F5E